jgi:hypothetical protein
MPASAPRTPLTIGWSRTSPPLLAPPRRARQPPPPGGRSSGWSSCSTRARARPPPPERSRSAPRRVSSGARVSSARSPSAPWRQRRCAPPTSGPIPNSGARTSTRRSGRIPTSTLYFCRPSARILADARTPRRRTRLRVSRLAQGIPSRGERRGTLGTGRRRGWSNSRAPPASRPLLQLSRPSCRGREP